LRESPTQYYGPAAPDFLKGTGIEIGAHTDPIRGIKPIYVDRFAEFAGARCLVNVISDAAALPFEDSSLDYVASSHLLEHLPNPILALVEWYRVVKAGGIIYIVVPDRRFTFDCERGCTSVAHLIEDFENRTDARDSAHVEEYALHLDLSKFAPDVHPKDWQSFRRTLLSGLMLAVQTGRDVNIHFHVFERGNLVELLAAMQSYERTRLSWELIAVEERYPPERGDGVLLVVKVTKDDFGEKASR
jgi:SAM-dependent methyltransferase